MPYSLPAKERGDRKAPDGYQPVMLFTDGKVNIVSIQNAEIRKSRAGNPTVMGFGCIDEGPLAGKCVVISFGLNDAWAFKYALRTTGADEGIPENTDYTFKDDQEVIDRMERISGMAIFTQTEFGENINSTLKYFTNDEAELANYQDCEPVKEPETADLNL